MQSFYAWATVVLLATAGCGNDPKQDTGAGGGGHIGGCDAANPDACDYPSLGLSFVEREGFSITDATTGRVLPLLVRIPDAAGPLPLVVLSHGGGFNPNGHRQLDELGDTLASHGYAVLHIAHVQPMSAELTAICTLAAIPAAECGLGAGDIEKTGRVALVKTLDTNAVLDQLPQLSQASVNQGGPAIDLSRVAVAGWSAGSRAPLITHGAVFYPTPSAPKLGLNHALPVAAIALSPPSPGHAGFFDEAGDDSWRLVRGPTLIITGDNDLDDGDPGAGRRPAYERQPADGLRWMLYSTLPPGVTSHVTFGLNEIGAPDERVARLSRAMQASIRAFLDAYVDDDANAQAWLASGNSAVLAGDAQWDHH